MLNVNMLRRAFHIVVIHAVGSVARHFYLAVGIMRRVFGAAAASLSSKDEQQVQQLSFAVFPPIFISPRQHILSSL